MRKLGNKLANRKTSTASWANAGPKWVCVLCEADNESTAKNCIYCDTPPLEPAVCLLCGALVCAGPNCRRRRAEGEKKEGECTRHARTCGCGTGMFYLAHQGMVLLMDSSCFYLI